MANFDFNTFLNILNEKQRNAVLSCRTEAEFEQVIDDFDIEIPDEMLEMVAGGRGKLIPLLFAGVLTVTGAVTASVATAVCMNAMNNSEPSVVTEVDHIRADAAAEHATITTTIAREQDKGEVHHTFEIDSAGSNAKAVYL